MRSAVAAWLSRWATISVVRPSVAATAARSRSRAPALPASAVASSRTATAGSARTRRASASCWAWAEVSCCRPPPRVARPSGRVRSPLGGADEVEGGGDLGVGGVRVGEAQVVGERPGEDVHLLADQGDLATDAVLVELASGTPRRVTAPSVGAMMPAMMPARVLLPAPLAPTRATRSPGARRRAMSRSTTGPSS